MSASLVIAVIAALSLAGFYFGRSRSVQLETGGASLPSLPGHYGLFVALWCGIPAAIVLLIWVAIEPALIQRLVMETVPQGALDHHNGNTSLVMADVRNLAAAASMDAARSAGLEEAVLRFKSISESSTITRLCVIALVAVIGMLISRSLIRAEFRARQEVERVIRLILIACSTIAILTTIGIVFSLIFETVRFFGKVPVTEFLFGLQWSPQTALRADQVGASGAFGAIPLFAGTLLITVIAMFVAGPIGLMAAIYMSEYAGPTVRGFAKPVLEILAGIPTVVYGFFAALTIAPTVRGVGESIGLDVASESALAAGLVMGIMIIPFISSLSDDVINSVPQSLRDGAYGLGATRSETIKTVILPAALPGIAGAFLLAISRAIGETMIVVMAAGLAANLTANPLQAVTTVTVQIVTLLVGDQEFDSAKTLAAFALGFVLFVITLSLNAAALVIVRKYREQYD